ISKSSLGTISTQRRNYALRSTCTKDRFLDLGVMGLQVPWVHSAEDAANAVRYVKYQPEGVRGLAGVRAPSPDHPLLSRLDVVATPHIASATDSGKDRLWTTAIAQVLQVLRGERPPHLVNPEGLGPDETAVSRLNA